MNFQSFVCQKNNIEIDHETSLFHTLKFLKFLVLNEYGVNESDLFQYNKQEEHIVDARRTLFYLLHSKNIFSIAEIQRIANNASRSTIQNGISFMEKIKQGNIKSPITFNKITQIEHDYSRYTEVGN